MGYTEFFDENFFFALSLAREPDRRPKVLVC